MQRSCQLVLVSVLVACNSAAESHDAGIDADPGDAADAPVVDAPSDHEAGAEDLGQDVTWGGGDSADRSPEAGTSDGSWFKCCEPGQSYEECCAGWKPLTCFAYGGDLGRCAEEGEGIDARNPCNICCSGLLRAPRAKKSDAGVCSDPDVPSDHVCVACGDGLCGIAENACNCPGDCVVDAGAGG